MIGEAAAFADKAHKGAFRKGTKIPYITHPMETAVIVSAFTDDEEIIAAALLHDVMEDAGVTREELEDTFGSRVADLVVDESEDKSRSWQERKTRTVRHLCTASRQRFNEKDKRKHARYYWGIAHALKELEDHLYFKEYVMLCRAVFGEDVISSNKDMMRGECE